MKQQSKLMQRVCILLLLCIGFTSCQSQPAQDYKTIEEQARALHEYAQKALSSDMDKKQEYLTLFFESFPNNFPTFFKIYGDRYDSYNDSIEYDVLLLAQEYTLSTLLPELKQAIHEQDYYKKMITVGVGGFWQADNVSALQNHLQDILPENVPLSVKVLEDKSEEEIKSFWRFVYDGPHPDHPILKELYDTLYPKISQVNPKVAELMKQAYEELSAEDDGHGH
ncbi:MAG: hypothetical protein ACXITV_09715 [Luteibaculaceae bacterium]